MSIRFHGWKQGPRAAMSFFLKNANVVARPNGITLSFESTKGIAEIVISADSDLPKSMALLRQLRDACDSALNAIERQKDK